MATKIDSHEFTRSGGRGAISRYARFFDGSVWKLTLGEDCPASPDRARSAIYVTARRRGLKVRTDFHSEPGFVFIQTYEPEGA